MRILVLPSWYPSSESPLAGIFFKEQVLAMANYFPSCEFVVLVLKNLGFKNNFKHLGYVATEKKTINNVTELTLHRNLLLPGKCERLPLLLKLRLKRDAKLIQQELAGMQFDLIHAHVSYDAGYYAMLLAQQLMIPYIITEHMSPFPFQIYPYLIKQQISDFVLKPMHMAKAIIAVSSSLARRIDELTSLKAKIIPNLVDESKYYPQELKKNPKFTFFSLGLLSRQKGMAGLIRAFAKLVEQQKDVQLIIGGDGDEKAGLTELISELKLVNSVLLLGALNRDEVVDYMNACDCFVLASKHETFGVVYAEAIACGKPIIATRCGGSEDIVNETNGLLCNLGDVDDLASKMAYLIAHHQNYQVPLIRADFVKRFSSQVVCQQIMDSYLSVLESNAK